jgi:hydrogenase nickel incorporation protein HypA/HybF
MHEIGLKQDALAVALEHATREHATRVERVTFQIGEDSGVVPEVIEMAFAVATRGTMAEGAQLAIEHDPLTYFCWLCGEEFAPGADVFEAVCPRCQQISTVVHGGREFRLVSLDYS